MAVSLKNQGRLSINKEGPYISHLQQVHNLY